MSQSRKSRRGTFTSPVEVRTSSAPAIPPLLIDAIVRLALALPICLPVLAFGGNVTDVEGATGVVLCLMTACLVVVSPTTRFWVDRRVQAMLAATTILALWPLFQLIPGSAMGVIAVQWDHMADVTQEPVSRTATLAVDETWRAVPVCLATWGAFWVGALGFANRTRQALLWVTILAIVVADCAYGIGIYMAGRNEVLGYKFEAWILDATGGVVAGTFINRNHFALLCCIGLALVITLMTRTRQATAKTTRQRLKAALDHWPVLVLSPVAVLLFVSVFLSQSRGGILSAIIVVATGLLMRIKSRKVMIGMGVCVLALVPILYAATFVTDYSRDRVTTRFSSAASERLAIQMETAQAIVETRGVGVGAGAFEQAFPLFRRVTPSFGGVWNAAHGSYIEWPFTYGIFWFVVLIGVTVALMTIIVGSRHKTGNANAALPILVLVACLLHISYDFGLQTLGLTIIVAALAGSSWGRAIASATSPSRRHAPGGRSSQSKPAQSPPSRGSGDRLIADGSRA
jgi:O-Antigen ligase